ncbi:DEAD/DEAH box helicase [Brevibacterium sp. CSND-B09]|uniref:DEAD/DEAH box helicase n=1 Tax=Brevibacterium sp. CSND-B09 TaxID=3462571 RepID=UPI00406A33DB
MARFYQDSANDFVLFHNSSVPDWRPPQRGALGSLLGHWAVHQRKPALIAIPTGSGKTAIALAAPYLARSRRALVVVPSAQLRSQIAEAFRTQAVLREIGAIADSVNPEVLEVKGRLDSWKPCTDADVVVALPQSISPDHYGEHGKPPFDLFDLVVVDEAHHAPARTWRAILDHFEEAKKVLLTATPKRRDGKPVPGEVVFHYPLRAAMDDGYYQSVEARLLETSGGGSREESDIVIRDSIVHELNRPEHASSALLIRAGSKRRVDELVQLYQKAGVSVVALTSDLGEQKRTQIIDGLIGGQTRAVAVVGMLGEGFDLPRLRLAAYHDKHRSVNSTIQLIGRLVRSHRDYPQRSVLATVRDDDVYPALKGAIRELYEEEVDWSMLLPGIIDGAVQNTLEAKTFAQDLVAPPVKLSLESIRPLVRATVFEIVDDWIPPFVDKAVPDTLLAGEVIRGQEIFYSTLTANRQSLLIVLQGIRSPRWHFDSGLDVSNYSLHIVTYIPAPNQTRRPMLLLNSEDASVMSAVRHTLGMATEHVRPADPERLHRAFDSLTRMSVSNVGVRNTYGGGRGSASYKMFAGSGVDRGMREADTAQSAIGHAMAQIGEGPGSSSYNIGFSVEKAKFWESRYVPLHKYDGVLEDFADRYWASTEVLAPLLPSVARGVRLTAFPNFAVAAIEMHPVLLGSEWTTDDGLPIGRLDLRHETAESTGSELKFSAIRCDSGDKVWTGVVDIYGNVAELNSVVQMNRGHDTSRSLAELFGAQPPIIYFLNGETVSGTTLYQPPRVSRDLSRWDPIKFDWSSTNIRKETEKSKSAGDSINKTLRAHLFTTPSTARRRWIFDNDGRGELADLIVVELFGRTRVSIELWHLKAAGGNKAVRVSDMQIVVAQAIKSRRWLTDRGLWQEMAHRYSGRSTPKLDLVSGDKTLLEVLLGLTPDHPQWSFANYPPQVRGKVVVAQPGLSWGDLSAKVQQGDQSAIQIRDLLAVFDDSLGALGESEIVCSD